MWAYTRNLDPNRKVDARSLTFDIFINTMPGSVGGRKAGTMVSTGGATGLAVPFGKWSVLTELGLLYSSSVPQHDATRLTSLTTLEGISVTLTNIDRDKGYQWVFTLEGNQETNGGGNTISLIVGYGWGRASFQSLYGIPGK
jgi:hypothetical protein